jgi:antitoxin MazE
MRAKIIKIGNSRGIMLSKQLLNQYAFIKEVEIIPNKEGVLITAIKEKPRQNWDKQFEEAKAMGHEAEGEMLEGFENDFDKNEWKW